MTRRKDYLIVGRKGLLKDAALPAMLLHSSESNYLLCNSMLQASNTSHTHPLIVTKNKIPRRTPPREADHFIYLFEVLKSPAKQAINHGQQILKALESRGVMQSYLESHSSVLLGDGRGNHSTDWHTQSLPGQFQQSKSSNDRRP